MDKEINRNSAVHFSLIEGSYRGNSKNYKGYKRILKPIPISTHRIVISITDARAYPIILKVEIY